MKIENDIQTLITRTEQLHKDAEKHISEKAYLLNYKKDNYKPPTYEDFLKYYITDYKCESFIYSGIYNNGSEVI
ncbi:MAG: hypothetical protein IPL23_27580 [Saprospiraceae bacterium]|nr:hypothetical protein [Saprospiraceae bacterium]